MKPGERRNLIAQRLAVRGELDFATLARELDVSEMTIRRDCEQLEADGAGRRVRRGISSNVSRSYEPPLAMRATLAPEAKTAIGRAAAALVSDGDTVVLDVGTTTLEVARHLGGKTALTVVTPSVPIAIELSQHPRCRILLTGGQLRPGELSLTGPEVTRSLEAVNCDVAFVGVAGIDVAKGLTEYNPDDAFVKQRLIATARRVVVVADATKLGRIAFATVCHIQEVDLLVTDAMSSNSDLVALTNAGLRTHPVARSRD